MTHSAAWFDRQLAHCRECLAEADKAHTAEEIAAARLALAAPVQAVQPSLFSVPPHAGVAAGGQPEPSGLAVPAFLGAG